jgi:DNA-binding transcriptional ArsR family regulator
MIAKITVITNCNERAVFDPNLLATFVAAAKARSFTEAGRRLGLQQSTVSQHVRRLEKRCPAAFSCATPTRWR